MAKTEHSCRWVLQPARVGTPAVYCGAKVSYRMIEEDDGKQHRSYDLWCEEHWVAGTEEDIEKEIDSRG